MIEEAIILAGGMGMRLKSITGDFPKPMADINGRPFLAHLFDCLKNAGMKTVVLSVCYNWETIRNYFGEAHDGISIKYSVEDEPLGTGGAIGKSFELTDGETVLVINGDTYFPVNIAEMFKTHKASGANITIALKEMHNFDRYGAVTLDDNGFICSFNEKKFLAHGLINGGIYLINRNLFSGIKRGEKSSFEKDILCNISRKRQVKGFISDAYFVDIGIPDDYRKAGKFFKQERQH